MKTLVILRGVSGSGKSTVAEFIENLSYDNGIICSADHYFMIDGEYKFDASKLKKAHKYCQQRCNQLMEEEWETIIIDNTNTQAWEMKPYFDMAKEHSYRVFSLIVENRHGGENIHGVSKESTQKMRNRFEIKL